MHEALKTIKYFNETYDTFTEEERKKILAEWRIEYRKYLLHKVKSLLAEKES